MLCRLALIERYSRENVMVLQVQWYGVDKWSNTSTDAYWHVGRYVPARICPINQKCLRLEKQCAPYVRKLEYQFLLERSARYQLVLSTVKQLRVYDLLDGLSPPTSSHNLSLFHCPSNSLFLSLFVTIAMLKTQRNPLHNLNF